MEYYDRQGNPCTEEEHHRLRRERRVALTELDDGTKVSTVYLGMDVNIGAGPPLIYETSASLGCDPETTVHSATEAEARAAHERMVIDLSA
jgi:hypothetical protein